MGVCLSADALPTNNPKNMNIDIEDINSDSNSSQVQINNNNNTNNTNGQDNLNSNMKSLLTSINRIPIIAALPTKQKLELAKCLVEKTYQIGEFLMSEGEPGKDFFLISKGRCEVYVGSEKVSELNDNDYCGEQALLSSNSKRTASIRAVETTTCYVMNRETFNSVIRTNNIQFIQRTAQLALSDSMDIESEDHTFGQSNDYSNNNGIPTRQIDPRMNEDILSWLVESVSSNLLFSDLSVEDKRKICENMIYKQVKNNESIIIQGDKRANEFFVIENGKFIVEKDGNKVDNISKSACVGELALVFNAARSATVKCINNANDGTEEICGGVWILTRSKYRYFSTKIRRNQDDDAISFLRTIPLFSSLYNSEITLMSRALKKEQFEQGTIIFNQGDDGDKFYLIMNGSVIGHEHSLTDNKLIKSFELTKHEWFGELALKYNQPRTATVIAKDECTCLVVSRKDFNTLFGSLDSLMERQIEEYQRPIQSNKDTRMNLLKRNLNDFISGPYVGKGKYGSVRFIKDPSTNTVYALKEIKKSWVNSRKIKQSRRRINALFNERNIMREFSNVYNASPFVVKLRGTFKDNTNVYFLLSAAVGGDFFNILKTRGYIDEKSAQFYIACLIEGIEYLHKFNMIHRDLKPENIVLDSKGYAQLTDFGFTKKLEESNNMKTYTLCGTPGYMAPEVILGHGYSFGSDWFSLGCVLYDMVTGAPPFPTRADQFTMIKTMMSNKLHLPMYLSFWIKDLIVNLLKIKSIKRLGVIKGGVNKIKQHHWFNDFDWNGLRNGTLIAPIQPHIRSEMDASNFDTSILDNNNSSRKDNNVPQIGLAPELNNWDVAF